MKLVRIAVVLLIGIILGDAGVIGGLRSSDAVAPTPAQQLAAQTAEPGQVFEETRLRGKTPSTASRYTVGYYGDSFAFSASEHAHHLLQTGGRLNVVGASFHGVAVCDLLPQMRADAAEHDMFGAVLVFAGNAFTPCMSKASGKRLSGRAALRKFEADLNEAVSALTANGTRVYLGTVPEGRIQAMFDINWARDTNRVVAKVANKNRRVELIDSATAVLDANGNYTETLPCLEFEPCMFGQRNLVRESTGIHFCASGFADVPVGIDTCPVWSSGAFRFAGALTSPVIEDAQRAWARANKKPKI